MNRRVREQAATDRVVVLDIPLLTENPREGLQGIIVVDVPEEVQVERLVRFRGFDEADARARIARQATRERRLETASFVVDNSGTPADLEARVDELWTWLTALPQLPPMALVEPASVARPRKRRTAANVRSASSSCGTWPRPSNMAMRLPAMSRWKWSALSGGMRRSCPPQMISVGKCSAVRREVGEPKSPCSSRAICACRLPSCKGRVK